MTLYRTHLPITVYEKLLSNGYLDEYPHAGEEELALGEENPVRFRLILKYHKILVCFFSDIVEDNRIITYADTIYTLQNGRVTQKNLLLPRLTVKLRLCPQETQNFIREFCSFNFAHTKAIMDPSGITD